MKVNIVSPGKFHYANYVRRLHEARYLNCYYFSHRIRSRFGIPESCQENLFLKEYFLRSALRILPSSAVTGAVRASHLLWRMQLRKAFAPADVNLFLMHGASLQAIELCKRDGFISVGEAVNMHPASLQKLLKSECESLGLPVLKVENIERIEAEAHVVDYILCPSSAVADSFLANGYAPDKVFAIPYGIDQQVAQHPALSPRREQLGTTLRLVCVGQINVRKGQHLLLRAVEHARSNGLNVELTLIGEADRSYMQLLRSQNAEFSHIPYVPHRHMLSSMQGYDGLVLPSIEDGFGLVVGEALSVRVPVVVSKFAGSSAIIRPGLDGFVINPFHLQQFADALASLADPAQRFAPGEYIRTWEDYAAELEELLSKLVGLRLESLVAANDSLLC